MSVSLRPMGADLPTYRPTIAGDGTPRALDVPIEAMTFDRALGLAFEYSPILESQGWETASPEGGAEYQRKPEAREEQRGDREVAQMLDRDVDAVLGPGEPRLQTQEPGLHR